MRESDESSSRQVLPSMNASDSWSIPELVASLKADDKSQPLTDCQEVFVKLRGMWNSGTVVMSREVHDSTCYTVMVGPDIYDLTREDLCPRVAPETESVDLSVDVPTDADSTVGDLAQSLKLNAVDKPVAEKQPVFAKVNGDWHVGVVLSVRSDAQQKLVYSIRVQHGVHDLRRDQICPRVQAPKKRRALPSWKPKFLNNFQRSKAASPSDTAEQPVCFPSAAAALGEEQGPREGEMASAVAESAHSTSQDTNEFSGDIVSAHVVGGFSAAQHRTQHASNRNQQAKGNIVQMSASLKGLLVHKGCYAPQAGEPLAESREELKYSVSQQEDLSTTKQNSGVEVRASSDGNQLQQQQEMEVMSSQAEFALCVSVHNGIHVIGREVFSTACEVRSTAESSWVTIQCTEQLCLHWVPQDSGCSILVELRQLAARSSLRHSSDNDLSGSRRLAWTVVDPFQDVSHRTATLNTAPQWIPMQMGPGIDPRGHPVYSFHALAVDACTQNHMLNHETCHLLEHVPQLVRSEPPVHLGVTLQPGSHPRPPSPQPPVFSHSNISFPSSPPESIANQSLAKTIQHAQVKISSERQARTQLSFLLT
jgi:hypothetical protein